MEGGENESDPPRSGAGAPTQPPPGARHSNPGEGLGGHAARRKGARACRRRQRLACPRGRRRPQGTGGSGGWQVGDAVPAFPTARSRSFWLVFL